MADTTFIDRSTPIVASWLNDVNKTVYNSVNVKNYGAIGDGITDDSTAIQAAITANPTKVISIVGNYLLGTGLNLNGFSGSIQGPGKLIAKSNTIIFAIASATGATGFSWDGVSIDMGQTSSTTTANNRCQNGIYLLDCRNLRFSNFSITNVAADDDRLIYVDGSSANVPLASYGSQNISFDNIYGEGFPSNTVDIGPQVLIRSDFYTGDNGATCIISTNGTKLIDYSEDTTVSFARTTQNIKFNNCTFKTLDRFSFLNCKDVYINNTILDNFNTRGFVGTYTCENIAISNCEISGNAASLVFNYACKNITATNLISKGLVTLLGQRSTFVFGAGVKHVRISNVTGFGHDISALLIQGAYDVTLENVTLRNPTGTTINVAAEIDGGLASNTASNWVTDRISLVNCEIECRYGFQFNAVTGSATIAKGGVVVSNAHFKNITALFTGTAPTNSEIAWSSGKVDVAGTILSSAFSYGALGTLSTGTNEIFPTTGSWTPVLAGSSVAGTNTLTNVDARWYRFGNLVYVEGDITVSVKDAAIAGNLEIRGLPFAAATRANAIATISFGYMSNMTLSGGYTTLTGLISSGTSTISFRKNASGLAGAPVPVGDLAAGALLVFSGYYLLA